MIDIILSSSPHLLEQHINRDIDVVLAPAKVDGLLRILYTFLAPVLVLGLEYKLPAVHVHL